MRTSQQQLHVLCIDDDAHFVEILSRRLSAHGVSVSHARDAIHGVHMATSERPDAIITDYCMPREYGTYLLRRLREESGLSDIPVIVVSGRDLAGRPKEEADEGMDRLLEQLGAECVLRKPLDWQGLYEALAACTKCDLVNEPSRQRRSCSHKTVMVVEDDGQAQFALEKHLKRSGFHVICAASGEEALQKAAEYLPDVVSMDVRLPDMDGLEVAERIQQNEQTRGTPIVFVTARVDRHFKETSRAVGGTYFVRKPYDPELLLSALNQAIGSSL